MRTNNIRRVERANAARLEAEAVDAVVDIRGRRRCHYERSGMDPVSLAVHLWAETGEVPGWDTGLDDGGDWAA
ncbi:hypothetical protein [Nocardia sp. NPDC051570]|uniref:hypothetical protein n=1 Tax=Nocardia sp. NPDC051570 TaxID=3364324 RepID=UPI0037B11B4E